MKRVNEYKKLFEVEGAIELGQLKTKYRNLVKEWHPDKFQADDEKAGEAEEKTRKITDGYHFLISISPETKAANLEEYTKTVTESGILNYRHKGMKLEVEFLDGTTYEYFGVTDKMYTKMVNADNPYRFGKRNIFSSFLYRKSKKDALVEA